ncbi:MAG TPA: CHAT domain-containing protein [Thermoanaerobaculia bacterium]|jgi:hypothetical protein|nr:CHAT domain-containing protein [Thermoanaerobaculia bacterium]
MKHIEPETLAALAEGRLTRKEIAPVLAHLRECTECTSDVEAVAGSVPFRERRRFDVRWMAAAAAVIAIVTAVMLLRPRDPMQRLVSLAPRSARIIEPRLTGGFAWAPYRGPNRADDSAADADRLRLVGAAGDAVAKARGDAASEHVAGVALLLAEKPEDAVARLRRAAEQSPSDARAWSDFAAALEAWAISSGRPSLHPQALAAADRALRIDADLPEALFNRALILEQLGLQAQARAAWEQYLRADPASPWTEEAREHLKRSSSSTGEMRFREEQPRLERAALSGDAQTVGELVARYPQQCRTFAEAEYLGRWGEQKDEDALAVARAIGTALAEHSRESLLLDAVAAIDSGDAARRATLAEAHAVYRRGRIAYSKQQPAAAQADLLRAAALFEQGRSPMSDVARYFAACARYDQEDLIGAREELERLNVSANPRYLALAAQVQWQLALTAMADGDWSSALDALDSAEAKFESLGERSNRGFIFGLQSTALNCLGRPDDAWRVRIEAFRMLGEEGRGDRLAVSIGGAARAELYAGRLDSARALLSIEATAHREARAGTLLASALLRQTLLDTQAGDFTAAANAAREASALAEQTKDGGVREVLRAMANVAGGAVALHEDARHANELLTKAIEFYSRSEHALFLPQALLLRARAASHLGDSASAARDLDDGLAAIERHRIRLAGPVVASDVLDAATALVRDALRMRLDSGDAGGAFACIERGRFLIGGDAAVSPVSAAELQQRLRGSGTAVILIAAVPPDTALIGVTENDLIAKRIRGTSASYDILIRPVESLLARVSRVVVVPDPSLQHVSFAALYDARAKQYLVERVAVAIAPNASSLRAANIAAPRRLLAVALPTGTLAPLPGAQRELAELRALYRNGAILDAASATFSAVAGAAADADVLHIAGHTARQPGAEDLALPFTGGRGSWRDIAAMHLEREPLVVVAGCETLRRPDARHTRALSLGESFLAAGAADVIGTLSPIADRDALDFFKAVHDGIASGLPASDALRRAQLDAIAREVSTGHETPWRAVALMTRRI